ncbi:protoporphyrinogen/coproporphyrinogen oxidase [Pseudobacteriovorax antillogorgiicola]|uniref:Protoporphyrinogen oxidase n=1 Tax=Pseudobacteriovorax antillogorgiicola TaxID=1513793 RepID=A0A1Y6CLG1_9BACT|nr:NAD(P)-binding protein [Pseudobacteriovorax antillogorgiicola]TCS45203.1 protoporphyrinogen oxidase [Pseudobacteriovorax antillogorgiicola]SMF75521.1 Protoporphyrinogen oxidase [Pseudobacteriovorax antillogorgiicola]
MSRMQWVVVGGGFRGMSAAYLFSKSGKSVTVVDKGTSIGGVLSSIPWNGLFLDKGCHLFDNDSDEMTDHLFELGGNEFDPVNVVYGSWYRGRLSKGIAIPDLRFNEDTSGTILIDILRSFESLCDDSNSLEDKVLERYGRTVADYFYPMIRKIYLEEASNISSAMLEATLFNRVYFLDDSSAKILKESKLLDEKIAASSFDDPLRYYREYCNRYQFRSFYPRKNNMRGFCDSVENTLRANGVNIQSNMLVNRIERKNSRYRVFLSSGTELVCDGIYWAGSYDELENHLGVDVGISQSITGVPMVLYYFLVAPEQLSRYSYIHNFDSDFKIFRVSSPSNYKPTNGEKFCDRAYVCCEVPINSKSTLFTNPEASTDDIWTELKKMGFIRYGSYLDKVAFSVPKSYSYLRRDFSPKWQELSGVISKKTNFYAANPIHFTKLQILRDLKLLISDGRSLNYERSPNHRPNLGKEV